jgi:membrane protein
LSVAAGVTFYGLLALFPTIAAILSVYGLIAESQQLTALLKAVDGALPTAGVEFLRKRIERIGNDQESTLSFALIISVVLALWSANRGMKALFEGLNVAYGEIERRTLIQLNIISINFTIGLLFFLIVAIFCVAAVPLMFNGDDLDTTGVLLIWIGRWPVVFLMLLMSLELLYRFGPNRTGNRWAWISPGALLASLVWLTGSFLFSTFLANFQDYDRTFGTLGAVDILLVWMWLSSISILIGAELNGVGEQKLN